MQNNPILKTVKLIKLNKETDEIIKESFTFGLYIDKECTKLIQQMDSNVKEGTVTFKDLRYGTYYIKEVSAPTGYILSDKVVKLEINEKGVFVNNKKLDELESMVSFKFYNKPIPKIQTGNEMNYILLISSFVISVIGIIVGIIVLRNKKKNKEKKRKKLNSFLE